MRRQRRSDMGTHPSDAKHFALAVDRKATHAPCTICGEACCSQLEFIESNGGEPWPTCSGCDPALREDGAAMSLSPMADSVLTKAATLAVGEWLMPDCVHSAWVDEDSRGKPVAVCGAIGYGRVSIDPKRINCRACLRATGHAVDTEAAAVRIGDIVERIASDSYNGTRGVVLKIASVAKRVGTPRLRIQIQWDRTGNRSWLAIDLERKTWRRVAVRGAKAGQKDGG